MKNMMLNTFIIVSITPACKREFRGKISAFTLQKGLPSPFSLARHRVYLYLGSHLK